MKNSVYWIHTKNHTDIFTQGYVGVSKNTVYNCINPQKKWNKSHKGHTFKRLEK